MLPVSLAILATVRSRNRLPSPQKGTAGVARSGMRYTALLDVGPLGHFGHRDGQGCASQGLDERWVLGVKRARLVDQRRIGFFGMSRQLLHDFRRDLRSLLG